MRFRCIADRCINANIGNGGALAGDPVALHQFLLQHGERRPGLGVIHEAHLLAELADAAVAGAQAIERCCQLVPGPEQPFADALGLQRLFGPELAQFIGEIGDDGGGLHHEGMAVAQRRHLAIAILHQIVGLLVLALTQVDVNIAVGVAAQGQHQGHGVGWTGERIAMQGEALTLPRAESGGPGRRLCLDLCPRPGLGLCRRLPCGLSRFSGGRLFRRLDHHTLHPRLRRSLNISTRTIAESAAAGNTF